MEAAAQTRRIAVMQPYFMPYLGYFQLMAAVDLWVVLDDVNFISRGWINRNRILLRGQSHLITVPLQKASQNRRICDIELALGKQWRERLWRTVAQAYARAPFRRSTMDLVQEILFFNASKLDEFLLFSLRRIACHLGLSTEIRISSRCYENAVLKAQDRIVDICARESAKVYVNAIGGCSLYAPDAFARQGVALRFLRPTLAPYPQVGVCDSIDGLSIVDVLMHNDIDRVREMLTSATLVNSELMRADN